MEKRNLKKEYLNREEGIIESIRPQFLKEYIGQDKIKANLEVFIRATKERNEPLGHILFWGPPGLGKTTLAYIIANELDKKLFSTTGPALERPGDLAGILANDLGNGDVLFIDEIHRLNRVVEEMLYPAMEDFKLDIVTGKGLGASTLSLKLPRFTLIGATTRLGLLTSPLRERFKFEARLEFYEVKDLEKIIMNVSKKLKIDITLEGAREIARRSRFTPRIAIRLLNMVRDFAQLEGSSINEDISRSSLSKLGIDELGLDKMDRIILQTIIDKFSGGPVGIKSISAVLQEDEGTIEDVYEPFLLQLGFLERTPRGRTATQKAYEYLGIKCPKILKTKQEQLF